MRKAARPYDYLVTVCDKCRMASCWHGTFMCQQSDDAGTIEVLASTLDGEGREHPTYYSVKRLTAITGQKPAPLVLAI